MYGLVHDTPRQECTGEYWKEQYRDVPEFTVPGTALINEVAENSAVLLAPTAIPAKKVGRPKSKPGMNSSDHAKAAASKSGKGGKGGKGKGKASDSDSD